MKILTNMNRFTQMSMIIRKYLEILTSKPQALACSSPSWTANFFNVTKIRRALKEQVHFDLIITKRNYSFKNTSSYETGLSDHHHLTYSAMKTTFKCEELKIIIYRKYSRFSQIDFQSDLFLNIEERKNNYLELEQNFVETFDMHAPKQTKIFPRNHKSNSNKTPRKAILKHS